MIYLGIRTDQPDAHLYLYDDLQLRSEFTWTAHRSLARDLLATIERFLDDNGVDFETISGIFVFQGPGSFTGLRIGITVANVMVYGLGLPIVGYRGDSWIDDSLASLRAGDNQRVVMPHYGSEPRITTPRK